MLADTADGSVELRDGVVVDPAVVSLLAPGTIVIASDGVGSVRRVVDAAGGITTEPASLFDAFATATYRYTLVLDEHAVDPAIGVPDIDVRAGLDLAPTIDLAFTIDGGGLAKLDAITSGTFDARIDTATKLPSGGWNGVKTIESRPLRFATIVDGVPVVLVARVITDLAVYAGGPATLETDVTAHAAFNSGIHFTRAGGWTSSDASRPRFEVHEVRAEGSGYANAVATMRIELAIYGEVVPYMQLRAISSVEAGNCKLLEATVGAGVGVERSTLLPGAELRYVSVFDNQVPIVNDATCQ